MAVTAGHLGGGHRAVAVLLDNARRCVTVACHTVVAAGGERIYTFRLAHCAGLRHRTDDQDQAKGDDEHHQPHQEQAQALETIRKRLSG
jgi:hypothetical protein